MNACAITNAPSFSPWGAVQHSREIAPGLIQVETGRHGGFCLSPERWEAMTLALPKFKPHCGPGWLEEDCEAAAAVLAFPEHFDDDRLTDAINMTRNGWLRGMTLADVPADLQERARARQAALVAAGTWERGSLLSHREGWLLTLRNMASGDMRSVLVAEYPTERHFTPEQVASMRPANA